jgi:hypothetical protein
MDACRKHLERYQTEWDAFLKRIVSSQKQRVATSEFTETLLGQ